ncbi:nitroreductase family deazaflavin-dependent oxidoreductase [Fodinicola acaciae]|uniref:nitroreductase family deazaflavin-dependent oxidoreductase n=1 Tax=Fodinicola acaciae TaxID=2681555 RepID=UPI0013D6206B|nr:nitroreductase family deazaflavin-dependent oxidoreductase [Fodinicola acaciae]
MAEQVVDSPTGWVADHIKQYVESDGKEGHDWRGVPTLLLTVVGRKTGTKRRTALIYGKDGDDYLLVASKGGAPKNPLWYENLVANPDVELQVGSDVFEATARTATAEEKERLWPGLVEIWPDYANYQKKTDRDIPVVILTRK